MWGIFITVFLGLYCLMSFYIYRRSWITIVKHTPKLIQIIYWVFFLLIVLSFPSSEFLENYLPEDIGFKITILGGYSIVAVSYTFLIILSIDFIRLLDKGIGFIPDAIRKNKKTPFILGTMVTALVAAAVTFGGINALNPVVKRYKLMIDKSADPIEQLNIVLVSDIHYGPIVNDKRLVNMVEMINSLKPDIVFMAGDIAEGSPKGEDAERLAYILGSIRAPYGVFAVPGNHDRGLRNDDSELSISLKNPGISILKDSYFCVEESFYVIGRDNPGYGRGRGRKDLEDLMEGIDVSKPLILLDHQPIDIENAERMEIDLQLSGHTHRGQVFPVGLITSQVFEQDWGLLNKNTYHLIVSSGYGTWGPPLRIGTQSEIVSITLKFDDTIIK